MSETTKQGSAKPIAQQSAPWKPTLLAFLMVNVFGVGAVYMGAMENVLILIAAQTLGMLVSGAILGYATGFAPLITLVFLFVFNFNKAITAIFSKSHPAEIVGAVVMLGYYFGVMYGASYVAARLRRRKDLQVTPVASQ